MEGGTLITVAALYVDPRPGGAYVGLPGVEVWGARRCPERPEDLRPDERDARLYAGPHPVVAHPPCGRWCRLAAFVESRYPRHRQGKDGGCFAAALAAVRQWRGVLEHPAYSGAWDAFGLLPPCECRYDWRGPDKLGGWTTRVELGRYGHPARKPTCLYAVTGPEPPPRVRWGRSRPEAMVCRLYREQPRPGVTADRRPRLSGRAAAATPPAFRDLLLQIARSCR